MRRRLVRVLPELAHYFHLKPDDLDDLTFGEVEEFMRRLAKLPPVGSVVVVEPAKRR